MIYISSDHGGFDLKTKILQHLQNKGYEIEDLGPFSFDPNDDYPDFAILLGNKVKEHKENQGILICRNGVGMCLVTNKIPGIRCGISWNAPHARSSKRDDDTNVIAIPADYIDEETSFDTIEAWLTTAFSEEERHLRRLRKIVGLEK